MLNATIPRLHFWSFLTVPEGKMSGWKGSNKYWIPVESIYYMFSIWTGWEVTRQTGKTFFLCMCLLLVEMILISLNSKISLCAKIQSNRWITWIVLSGLYGEKGFSVTADRCYGCVCLGPKCRYKADWNPTLCWVYQKGKTERNY